jgi:hypothetical protein
VATSAPPLIHRRPRQIQWRLWCGGAAIFTLLYGVSIALFARVGAGLNDSGAEDTLANVAYVLGIATVIVALLSLIPLAGSPLAGAVGSALAGMPPLAILFMAWEGNPSTIGAIGTL